MRDAGGVTICGTSTRVHACVNTGGVHTYDYEQEEKRPNRRRSRLNALALLRAPCAVWYVQVCGVMCAGEESTVVRTFSTSDCAYAECC
jgi:hypothetical protein